MSQDLSAHKRPVPSPKRLADLFLQLASIPSPSRDERALADCVRGFLADLGLAVHEDDVARKVEGNTGNLHCLVGRTGERPCLMVCAHLDTVAPTDQIEPVLGSDNVFRNTRPTILGADDKVALAATLHATELLVKSGRPFPAYEILFTVCEEIGLLGARNLAPGIPQSRLAVVLDSSGAVGDIVVRAPGQKTVKAAFHGVAAHAGLDPERGRNAIVAASRAVAAMRLGRLDHETTANIGLIHGGVATNIVPEHCEIQGECRSHDQVKLVRVASEMVDAIHAAAAEAGVDVDVRLDHEYGSFSLDEASPAVSLAKAALAELGVEPRLVSAGGGSDANVLNARGIPTPNLSAGMMHVHSPDEHLDLRELLRLCEAVLNLVFLAPRYSGQPETTGQ